LGEYHDFDDGLSAVEIVNDALLVIFRSLRLNIRVTGVIQRRSMKRPTGARPTAPGDMMAVTTTWETAGCLSNDMFAVTGQGLSRLSHHVDWDQGTDTFLRH
jgi:hypothetical protein